MLTKLLQTETKKTSSTALSRKPGVLLIGNFLSALTETHSVCEDLAVRLKEHGLHVITTSDKLARIPRLLDMLITIFKYRNQYGVAQIDTYSGPAFIWAEMTGWLLQKLNKPFVLTLHGGSLPQFGSRWPGRLRRLLRSASVITTPSRYLLEAMQPYRPDICLLPNPLDLGTYRFQLRKNPRPHLIWLRAFHHVYNPTLAPRVLAQLLPDFPNACLTMIGPDKEDGSLQTTRKIAQHLGVQDRIAFSGGVPKTEVPLWLNKGDIFINTTNVDNTPVSVIEAMACGLCVVSTNVGGIPYLLEDEIDALLVPPDDPESMAAAVCRVLIEPNLATRLSQDARHKAEGFDWSTILPQWETLFEQVIAHG
jgi:glycosyltransferase involved in cell wall biosynthesis